jgi:hypothetical protein
MNVRFASPHFSNNRDKLGCYFPMLVRVRLKHGPIVQKRRGKNRKIAAALSAFLTPAALMCSILALWKIGSDLDLTGEFAIAEGIFSRWQLWLAAAAGLQVSAWVLNRYGISD